MSIAYIFVILLALLLGFYLFRAFVIVPQGYEYTLERLGRYIRTLSPGFHIVVPFIDRIGAKVNVMENVLDVPSQDVITKDNAAVTVDGVVFFQIFDASRSVYEVHKLDVAVMNLTMTNIRTVMGSMDLDELLSQRESINARLLSVLDDATGPWGIKVTRIEIKDIRPPKDLVESMGRQMKAERDKRALILEAEGKRQAAVLQAEGKRQAQILNAEGLKESMILEAEARLVSAERDASARERLAQAEATATQLVSNAIKDGNKEALNYFVAQKYVEAFSHFASSPNQKTIFMPMEVSSLVGSLGGIAQLFQKDEQAVQPVDSRETL
jgi:regulator of protease activity HflC (stomatin/prohibitin superfamily)